MCNLENSSIAAPEHLAIGRKKLSGGVPAIMQTDITTCRWRGSVLSAEILYSIKSGPCSVDCCHLIGSTKGGVLQMNISIFCLFFDRYLLQFMQSDFIIKVFFLSLTSMTIFLI